jgi:hypothetical protein
MVLQRREFLDVLGRQEVRARRQYLAKLRVSWAEFLERGSQPLGLPAPTGRTLLVGVAEQLPKAMFGCCRAGTPSDLPFPRYRPRGHRSPLAQRRE